MRESASVRQRRRALAGFSRDGPTERTSTDYIIDLSREGGSGGWIVARGTPEEVAAVPASYTGQFLGPLLDREKAAS